MKRKRRWNDQRKGKGRNRNQEEEEEEEEEEDEEEENGEENRIAKRITNEEKIFLNKFKKKT